MGRIDDQWCVTCKSEFTTRDISCVGSAINWKAVTVVKFKCVCGCLLYIEQSVVQLFHACREYERHCDKLGCPNCLAVFKTMAGECYDDGKGSGNRRGCLLSYCKMARRGVGVVGIAGFRLRVYKIIKRACWILGIGACAWYCCHLIISK